MEVTCLDENDSPPVFDENLKIVLSEAYLPGHRIAKVKATDKDLVSVKISLLQSRNVAERIKPRLNAWTCQI